MPSCQIKEKLFMINWYI